ncbi:MAG: YbaK/EbsC family protein [bacterium]|nr:YbaK/EbsC family protein [bacterium]
MALSAKLKKLLDAKKVKYTVRDHKKVFTAYDLAQTMKEKLEHIAKTIVVRSDNSHLLVVLPGNRRVDFSKLKKFLKAKKVDIDREGVMQAVFKVKPGAITAFGGLYKNTPVLVDKALTKVKKVVASAGNFEQALHMTAKEFLKATEAKLGDFSEKAKLKLQVKPKKK